MSIQYILRNGKDKLLLMRKGETLSDDNFSYTTSGNNITVTSYIGSDIDVKIIDKFKDYYVLARPDSQTLKKYTITYDESEYITTPEEDYGLIINSSTKENVDLGNDFIIVQE